MWREAAHGVAVRACLALALVVTIWSGPALAAPRAAAATDAFLNSIGIVTTFPDRGQPLARTIEMIRYCGFRWVRAGIEGLSDDGPTTIQTFLDLHRETGVRLAWGLVSGGTDVKKLVVTGRVLAEAGALLAFEGNNEPNNWGVTYQGETGGGRAPSWMAVARLQRDLYKAVKSDPRRCRSAVPRDSHRRQNPDARRHHIRRRRQRAQLHLSSAFALSRRQQDVGRGRSYGRIPRGLR